jgi:hypothetical protein
LRGVKKILGWHNIDGKLVDSTLYIMQIKCRLAYDSPLRCA